jgi:Spy/CpxP family protein refolding chaperone
VAIGIPVYAQVSSPLPAPVTSESARSSAPLPEIELTIEQQKAFNRITSLLNNQIATILTSDQNEVLQEAIRNGGSLSDSLLSLDLSNQQKTDLQDAFQTAQQQVMGLLTPQQQQQLLRHLRQQPL